MFNFANEHIVLKIGTNFKSSKIADGLIIIIDVTNHESTGFGLITNLGLGPKNATFVRVT